MTVRYILTGLYSLAQRSIVQSLEEFLGRFPIKRFKMSKIITVFGATGSQGGGVVSALLKAICKGEKYTVRAVTRNPDGPKGKDLQKKGCEVVKCDMDDKASVEKALAGAYGVFLVTNYGEHFSKEKEIDQGKRVVDVGVAQGVKHFVYSGLENVQKLIGIECAHFDGKGQVEEYLRSKKDTLPSTIVRFSFYFNNLVMMKAKKVSENTYSFSIPMQGVPMDGVCVTQAGECVYGVLKNLAKYRGKTIGLSGDKLTIQQYADTLTKHLSPRKFLDSGITLDEYRAQGWPGALEMGNMFEFYVRGNPDRDIPATKELNPGVQNFEEWVKSNKKVLEDAYSD